MTMDGEDIDTANKFMVGKSAGKVTIMMPPKGGMTKHDALVLAAWIVVLADDDGLSFEAALDAVQSC